MTDKVKPFELNEDTRPLFEFCYLMLNDVELAEQTILEILSNVPMAENSKKFKSFGPELKVELFRKTWEIVIGKIVSEQYPFKVGRDTRGLHKMDEDLIRSWQSSKKDFFDSHREEIIRRIRKLDPDLKAPLILRDMLEIEEDDILQILKIRWASYRHRLHRARVEMVAMFRAKKFTLPVELKPVPLPAG